VADTLSLRTRTCDGEVGAPPRDLRAACWKRKTHAKKRSETRWRHPPKNQEAFVKGATRPKAKKKNLERSGGRTGACVLKQTRRDAQPNGHAGATYGGTPGTRAIPIKAPQRWELFCFFTALLTTTDTASAWRASMASQYARSAQRAWR
jgi:hypothetical protein